MARNSFNIISAASIILSILAINIIDGSVKSRQEILELNSSFYIIATAFCSALYFIILFLYVNHITNHTMKVAISFLFLGGIVLIFPRHFFLKPTNWDIEFHLISNIDMGATIVFLVLIYLRDVNARIVSSIIVSLFVLFINEEDDPRNKPFNSIVTTSLATIIYAIICWLYVSRISDHKWKIMTVSLFFFALVGIILTYIFMWFSWWELFCLIILGLDTVLIVLYVLYKRTYELFQDDQYSSIKMPEFPTRFTFKELDKATENFQIPIGGGGSGTVFKGTLDDGLIIAVKCIEGQQRGENEFKTELTIITSLQHINLVHLLGYCLTPRGDRYLVYPFFENGSLDAWLFANEEKRSCLTWNLRYQIAVDVAKALAYMHHECRHRILHLDVKPANILLDGGFRALVSDFGFSRSMEMDESNVMTRARGTVGYLPPEMLVPNAISTKSDVYSYGMVLLELVGGRKNFQSVTEGESRERRTTYFPKIAREKMKEDKLMEVIDKSLIHTGHITEEEVRILVNVAFWCIQENPELRPKMTDGVDILEGRKAVDVPPECPMFVVNFLDMESQTSFSKYNDKIALYSINNSDTTFLSTNSVSVSIESGR